MEDIRTTFILQVKTWLEKNKLVDADRHVVYQYFIGQCEQYGITEEEFYAEILRPAYRDAHFDLSEDPDPPNPKHTHVTIFGVKLQSLKMLGQVLFDNQAKSAAYFEDMSLIKSHVDTLDSGDEALAYASLYKGEQNQEKRYLKIVYHLNPKLPYRLGNKKYATLESIFEDAFEDKSLYDKLYNDFVAGKLAIWLDEVHAEHAGKISGGKSYNSFLRFVYKVDPAYPFYLGRELYANPHEIVLKAQKDLAFRKQLFEAVNSEQLFTWFDCIGRSDWQLQYQSEADKLAKKQLTGDDLIYASIHKLIRIIDPEIPAPKIKLSEKELIYTSLEASKPLTVPLKVELVNTGFVTVAITADTAIPGTGITQTNATFFDLTNAKELSFSLQVNPLVLTKDKLYSFHINVTTDYESLSIPVKLKAVFPLKTFLIYIGKYAAIGFVLLAGIRFALQSFTKSSEWLYPELIVTDLEASLPEFYPAFLFLFLLLCVLVAVTYPLIKKTEKI